METKKCSKCGEEKPLSEFYRDRRSKNGYRSYCKSCYSEVNAKYRRSAKGILTYERYKLTENYKNKIKRHCIKLKNDPKRKEYNRVYQKSYSKTDKYKAYQREYARKAWRRDYDEISDRFVKTTLSHMGIHQDCINDDIIVLKRAQILIKRIIKEKEHEQNQSNSEASPC